MQCKTNGNCLSSIGHSRLYKNLIKSQSLWMKRLQGEKRWTKMRTSEILANGAQNPKARQHSQFCPCCLNCWAPGPFQDSFHLRWNQIYKQPNQFSCVKTVLLVHSFSLFILSSFLLLQLRKNYNTFVPNFFSIFELSDFSSRLGDIHKLYNSKFSFLDACQREHGCGISWWCK